MMQNFHAGTTIATITRDCTEFANNVNKGGTKPSLKEASKATVRQKSLSLETEIQRKEELNDKTVGDI